MNEVTIVFIMLVRKPCEQSAIIIESTGFNIFITSKKIIIESIKIHLSLKISSNVDFSTKFFAKINGILSCQFWDWEKG